MSALEDKLAKLEAALEAATKQIEFLTKTAGTATLQQLAQREEDRLWYATQKIAQIEDPKERARQCAALENPNDIARVFRHGTPASNLQMYRAATKKERERLDGVLVGLEGVRQGMMLQTLTPPRRVRLSLRADLSGVDISAVEGATKNDFWPGVKFSRFDAGVSCKVWTEHEYKRALEISATLAGHVAAGNLVVEAVSDAESAAMFRTEIAALPLADRPRMAL